MSEIGYLEGQNLAIEYRWADGHYDQLPDLAADLVARKVDVIVTVLGGGDPVTSGLVASLARPDGNLTGFRIMAAELMTKRIELLSELVPQARVIALLNNPNEVSQRGGSRPFGGDH